VHERHSPYGQWLAKWKHGGVARGRAPAVPVGQTGGGAPFVEESARCSVRLGQSQVLCPCCRFLHNPSLKRTAYGRRLASTLGLTMNNPSYAEWRQHIEKRFSEMQPIGEPSDIHHSPSGTYSLEIIQYTSGPESWNYSRGLVRHNASKKVIADVKRNLAGFWFAWVLRPDGEYLLCGEDYQGYNVLDLGRGVNALTFPVEAYKGLGFCWGSAHPSPTTQLLAVEGCYWGGPNEIVIFDFSEACRSPLPEIARIEETLQAKGWLSDSEFEFTVEDGQESRSVIWKAGRG
jgi:hypothetical protein